MIFYNFQSGFIYQVIPVNEPSWKSGTHVDGNMYILLIWMLMINEKKGKYVGKYINMKRMHLE